MSEKEMTERLAEMIETQNKIMKLQSKAINGLFLLLHQFISAQELDELPELKFINEVAALRREMEGV